MSSADPVRIAAFLRTLAMCGATLADTGGRYVVREPMWQWLQPEVDLWQAGLRAALQQQAQREATR